MRRGIPRPLYMGIKELLKSFLNSLYNSDWLKKQRLDLGKAWSYFALFIFALSVVVAVPVSLQIRPAFRTIQNEFVAKVPDFEAKLTDGSLVVNRLSQPYIYRSTKDDFVIVIDTSASSSNLISDYVTSSPAVSILVNSKEVSINDTTQGTSRSQKWPVETSGAVTKQDIVNSFNQILKPWFYFIIVLAIFVGLFIAYFISKLYSIAVVTLFVYISSRLSHKEFKLKELFAIGLYATTLPTIIELLVSLTGYQFSYIHFLALLAFMLAIVYTKPAKEITK